MIDWIERARFELAARPSSGADETDRTLVSSVSSVPGKALRAQLSPPLPPLSSVSSVAAQRDVAPLASAAGGHLEAARRSGNPYLTATQGDDCHAYGWSDAEICTFQERARRFALLGRQDSEHLAERLTLRDRQGDGRHLCLECQELDPSGVCAAARRGQLGIAEHRFKPTPDVLMRCSGFRGIDFHER